MERAMKKTGLTAVMITLVMLVSLATGCSSEADEGGAVASQTVKASSTGDDGSSSSEESSGIITSDTAYYSFCSEGLDSNGFFEGVTASDYVTLPEYIGLTISAVTEDELQEQLDALCEDYAYYEELNGTVQDGDTINIDYVGSVDGVEFDGGSTQGQGTTVTIGVTSYIDDFLEQLIGHETGENFDITVTFPDPYTASEELSGKEAVFNVTINYIQGEEVIPEITDEIAQENGFDTVEDLVADIESWLLGQKALSIIFDEIDCIGIPDEVEEYYRNYMEGYYENYAEVNYGIDLDTFLGYYGYESFDELYEESYDEIFAWAVRSLAYQAIAELEGLEVTDDDIDTYGYTAYELYYGTGYTKQIILQEYVVPDFLVANAVIE